jgi:hypothetical protein
MMLSRPGSATVVDVKKHNGFTAQKNSLTTLDGHPNIFATMTGQLLYLLGRKEIRRSRSKWMRVRCDGFEISKLPITRPPRPRN